MCKRGLGTILFGRQRWVFALAIGLPLSSLLLPDSASASCGDYVIFRPQAHATPVVADHLPLGNPDRILPVRAPCDGPLCRGGKPTDPAPTPPTPQQVDQRPLALLEGSSDVACPFLAGGGWPRLDESPLDGFRQSLLRPPCA